MPSDSSRGEAELNESAGKGTEDLGQLGNRETAIFAWLPRPLDGGQGQALPPRVGPFEVLQWVGRGGFGVVYKARDTRTGEFVALKVLRKELCEAVPHRVAFQREAATAMRLAHPNLLRVSGLEEDQNGRPFIIEQFLEGGSLRDWATPSRRGADEVVRLMIPVAEAIAYLHRMRLFHRDLKPNNILLDASGQPYVSDFGLAIHETELSDHDGEVIGTYGYMAPEQIRGRIKRVDGRTDIWSLGVILYELLTGRLPFGGGRPSGTTEDYFAQLTEAIEENDPEPLRTFAPALSRELEDICLRCLEKEKRHRFKTGDDLAEALRRFQQRHSRLESGSGGSAAASAVVPRGLRSFEQADRDFFLELLPGTRDREGLPEVVSFWKDRLGLAPPQGRLDVCVVYGPSGSGKSSLIKAGVLPALGAEVWPIVVECTSQNTEARVKGALLRALAEARQPASATATLAELCAQVQLAAGEGRKFLLVLDQFEQWLHAHPEPHGQELTAALEHCNGRSLQALLLVRDDFWMPLSRLADELSIALQEGVNCRAVDLFTREHARRVLVSFGRAYGQLPLTDDGLTLEHEAFLTRAIEELAEHDRVICVRLALFADLMRGRPWNLAELAAVGGAKGVGVTFLEEKFGPSAPIIYRTHRAAAQRVLGALLPQAGAELRGQMRTVEQLRQSAATDERSFGELLTILDRDLKLLTPTTPGGADASGAEAQPSGSLTPPAAKYYQLTHDFLVPVLSQWLTTELRRTRRGQASLHLRERAEDWNRRPEPRRLPTLLQWLTIRALVNPATWTVEEARLMRAAGRRFLQRGLACLLIIAAVGWAGYEWSGRERAKVLFERLVHLDTEEVPTVLAQAHGTQRWLAPLCEHAFRESAAAGNASGGGEDPDRFQRGLHAALALTGQDAAKYEFVLDHLARVEPEAVPAVAEIVRPLGARAVEPAWAKWSDVQRGGRGEEKLPVAALLAQLCPEDERWNEIAASVARDLVAARASRFSGWLRQLAPAAKWLRQPLLALCRSGSVPGRERTQTMEAIALFGKGDSHALVAAAEEATLSELPLIRDAASEQARAAAQEARREFVRLSDKAVPARPLPESLVGAAGTLRKYQGAIDGEQAYAAALPGSEFEVVTSLLAAGGYRPEAVRSWGGADEDRLGVVWRRDGKRFRWRQGLSSAELATEDERATGEPFAIRDVAREAGGRWLALWVQAEADGDEVRLAIDVPYAEHLARLDSWPELGFLLERFDVAPGGERGPLVTAIWRHAGGEIEPDVSVECRAARTFGDLHPGQAQVDLRWERLPANACDRLALWERHFTKLRDAEEESGTARRNLEFTAGRYQLFAGQYEQALATFDRLRPAFPVSTPLAESRALTLLWLGRVEEARAEIERLERLRPSTARDLRLKDGTLGLLQLFLALRRGEAEDAAVRLKDLLQSADPNDRDSLELMTTAQALVAQFGARDAEGTVAARKSAIALLAQLVEHRGTTLPEELVQRTVFDGLREEPAFAEFLASLRLDNRFSAAWSDRSDRLTRSMLAMDAEQHAREAEALRRQGYLPRVVAGMTSAEGSGVLVSSIWECPATQMIELQARDRQIASLALLAASLGEEEPLAEILADTGGIEARSWVIEGAAALLPVERAVALLRDARSGPVRRNVLRLLGNYDVSQVPAAAVGEVEQATGRPCADAGELAAQEWLRRRWKLAAAEGQPQRPEQTANWYRAVQGHVMHVLDFRRPALVGSPVTDREREAASETLHWVAVGRRVAFASCETTVQQFEAFLADPKVKGHYARKEFKSSKREFAPEPACPQISVRWFDACRYCQWLSEKEGLPPAEWCFPGIWDAEEDEWQLPANLLARRGYRLPTEAEMELACRGGTTTSRPFGNAAALLPAYGWHAANARRRTHPVGSLKPNDFGLFDVLGNVNEWCLDAYDVYRTPLGGAIAADPWQPSDEPEISRVLRGGSVLDSAQQLRSANRRRQAPHLNAVMTGFRVVRTERD